MESSKCSPNSSANSFFKKKVKQKKAFGGRSSHTFRRCTSLYALFVGALAHRVSKIQPGACEPGQSFTRVPGWQANPLVFKSILFGLLVLLREEYRRIFVNIYIYPFVCMV